MNAGTGSNLTWDGIVECDASIMDGESRRWGAVGAVPGVQNPVHGAFALVQQQLAGLLPGGRVPPMMVAGASGAETLARLGVLLVNPDTMVTDRAQRRHQAHRRICADAAVAASSEPDAASAIPAKRPRTDHADPDNDDDILAEWNHDTVGAIAMDHGGHIAAAVSSGGISLKSGGRVGEAAVFGAGCWAQDERPASERAGVGVSCSGTGEHIMQALLAKSCADALSRPEDEMESNVDRIRHVVLGAGELVAEPSVGLIALTARDGSALRQIPYLFMAMPFR
ncbi:hypothetical protein AMAG_08017 [Allomyces macrogynus ATCC 38327]|uniref:Asparaginase n=1 Tax=Allomyces macrogynus (strain ATCC 38327) TaxID=578462 RepID=A0A0L0SK24_ALLM3|nr:hypothetical protein AMAG_08017 [Allomyces macrogynus ATCC 38327]|eukprot:KNE62837.1 hypothetical protein AMAG_08017 [Allomyces macrogynus ATCC 38327]